MNISVPEICTKVMDALRNTQYNESTIRNYCYTLNFLQLFADEQGYQNYTPELGAIFQTMTEHPRTGEFSLQRYKMRTRCICILNRFYETGIFDFSMKTKGLLMPNSPTLRSEHGDYYNTICSEFDSENTIHFYRYLNYHFMQYLANSGVQNVSLITSRNIIDYLRTVKDNMQRATLCGLRNYFRYLGRDDLLASIEGISGIRIKTIIPTLTKNEQSLLWSVIDKPDTISFRDKSIILLSLTSGMRACDIVKLTLSDISWRTDILSFVQSKTGNEVNLPLIPSVGNAIANYLTKERPEAKTDILFLRSLAPFNPLAGHSSCYLIIKNIFRLANVDYDERICGTRMLRHNAATSMLKNDVPIETIAAVLGHSNPDTTNIYLTTDDTNLRACVLPLFPVTKGVLV